MGELKTEHKNKNLENTDKIQYRIIVINSNHYRLLVYATLQKEFTYHTKQVFHHATQNLWLQRDYELHLAVLWPEIKEWKIKVQEDYIYIKLNILPTWNFRSFS